MEAITEATNKPAQLALFNETMLNKTLTMFQYENLPDTIPQDELEKMLQRNGYAIIAKVNGDLYAFQGGFSGQDAYYRPTEVTINNPALNFNETLEIGTECVVIKSDPMEQGLIKLFEKYGSLLIENQITMVMNDYNLRMPFVITSSDDQTTASAKLFLQKIIDGNLGVVTENKLWESFQVNNTANHASTTFADLYGYQQYLLSALNNHIGLATNNNMKRERLTTNEVEVNKNASYPLVDNMLSCRETGIEQVNALFKTDIRVAFTSIWAGIVDGDNDDTDSDNNDNSESISNDDDSGVATDNPSNDDVKDEPEADQEAEKDEPEADQEPEKDEPEADQEPEKDEPEADQEPEKETEKKKKAKKDDEKK